VWVHHLRHGNNELRKLLDGGEVLCHPFIVGELACGTMKNRVQVLDLLKSLPEAVVADNDEVMQFLENKRFHGLGWVDLHLLASATLNRAVLWTMDRALRRAADRIARTP
jgi:predicted nucleic acid-binding protein